MTRFVPSNAPALGIVRAIVHGVFLLSILFSDLTALAQLPVTILRPTGVMHLFSWEFYERLLTPGGMLTLKCALVVSLLMSACGFLTRYTTITSALLVIFYQGLLRSFGHFNHDEMIGIYFLVILACTPCGDGFALDSLSRATPRRRQEGLIYGYPILLMRVLLAWVYFSSALVKLRVAGFGYFSPDNLPALAISHSLDNLHDTHFRLAFWLPAVRQYLPLCVGVILIWELLFPLAVFWKRARAWILLFGVGFHLATLFLMNIFFPVQLAMYLVFIDWPETYSSIKRNRLFKLAAARWNFFEQGEGKSPGKDLGETGI